MANEIKQKKISSDIQKYLTLILQREIKSVNFHNVIIHEVKISNDLGNAKIFYSVLNPDSKKLLAEKLTQHNKEIRAKLASKLTIYRCPTLSFVYDEILDHANKIEDIIKKINH